MYVVVPVCENGQRIWPRLLTKLYSDLTIKKNYFKVLYRISDTFHSFKKVRDFTEKYSCYSCSCAWRSGGLSAVLGAELQLCIRSPGPKTHVTLFTFEYTLTAFYSYGNTYEVITRLFRPIASLNWLSWCSKAYFVSYWMYFSLEYATLKFQVLIEFTNLTS